MGLLTSLLTEHMRGKREKERAASEHKLQALTNLLGNENVPDPVHEWAWSELQNDKAFKDMKPVIGMIQQAHGQLKQPRDASGAPPSQGPPQLPQMPGKTPILPYAPPGQLALMGGEPRTPTVLPPLQGDRPQEAAAKPAAPPRLAEVPQTEAPMTAFRPIPPVPGTPEAGGGQPPNPFAAFREQKQKAGLEDYRSKQAILHANRMDEIRAQAAQHGVNLTKAWVKRPGSDTAEQAFIDPRNPHGYVDVNNQPIPDAIPSVAPGIATNKHFMFVQRPGGGGAEQAWTDPKNPTKIFDMTGKEIQGAKVVQMPRELLSGENLAFFQAAKYQNPALSDEEALQVAGNMVLQARNPAIQRAQQAMKVTEQETSGIGPGPGIQVPPAPSRPSTFTAPPVPGTAPAAKPAEAPASPPTGTPASAAPPAGRTAATRPSGDRTAVPPPPAAGKTPIETLPAAERDSIERTLTGMVTAGDLPGGGSAQMALGRNRDMTKIARLTGVPTAEIDARVRTRKADMTSYGALNKQVVANTALDNSLKVHGQTLIGIRDKLPETDVRFINEWLNSNAVNFPSAAELRQKGLSDQVARYGLALQAVRNEYARVIASGAQSAGQTAEGARQEANEVVRPWVSKGNTKALVDQMAQETNQKITAYTKELKSLSDRASRPIVPELYLPRGGGKKLDKETGKKFYEAAGGDLEEAKKMVKRLGWTE